MTKSITVKVSPETAARILKEAEIDLAKREAEIVEKRDEVKELKNALYGKLSEPVESLPLSVEKSPSGKRAKRGQTDKAITAFLSSQRGKKFSQAQIADHTGSSMTSCFRALNRLIDSKLVQKDGPLFFIP